MGKHGKPVTVTRYLRQMIGVGHPLADSKGMAYQHRFVLYEKIGPGEHPCHWCGKGVVWLAKPRLVADHLNEERHDNVPENLVPSCVTCNSNRAQRPDFFTHCSYGHEWTPENSYIRPDTGGRQCRACAQAREKLRVRKKK